MHVLTGLMTVLAVVLLCRWLWGRFAAAMWRSILSSVPRAQNRAFVLKLRELVFNDPYAFMTTLSAADAGAFVQRLWKEVGWNVARARQSTTPADPRMDVQQFRFADGRTIAVVCLPPPEQRHETLFIGVVLPMHPSLQQDLPRARQLVRFFYLNRFGGSRDTDLCGWTINRELRTYNIGAPKYPQGFASVVEAKLLELRQ